MTPLRRAWAPVTVVVGWAVHDPGQAQKQLTKLTATTLLAGLAALVLAAALYGFLTWWFTHFAVTETELRIRTACCSAARHTYVWTGCRPSTSPGRCWPVSPASPS